MRLTSTLRQNIMHLEERWKWGATTARFILTANDLSGVNDAIQSRCAKFDFQPLKKADCIPILEKICKAESLIYDTIALEYLLDEMHGDMRHSINTLQRAMSYGGITIDNVRRATGSYQRAKVESVIRLALQGDLTKAINRMTELIVDEGIAGEEFMRYAGLIVGEVVPSSIEAAEAIGVSEYRIVTGAHTKIELTSLLAKLAKVGSESESRTETTLTTWPN